MLELQLTGGDVCKFYGKGSARILERKCKNPMMNYIHLLKIFNDNFFLMIFLNLCFVWILCYWSCLSHVICHVTSSVPSFVMSRLQSHHEFSSVWGVLQSVD